ncbi:sensor histidine kinase [Jiella avicenniae]|uniref:histidine kinase n=1 Tax=Jiella avicenniae TaxID=2907202 RepID=A0A9X1T5E4_9HYPH|nr:sensor histidine kinase [Jiella avicenniae]MCE7027752.1 sensor histidine kinase [Jiella avicenniae]MCE7028794.1 sensor histidine kinase [Jiella avicenniae]
MSRARVLAGTSAVGSERRPYSLRRRLMAASMAAFAVLIALLSAGLWTYARSSANQTYDLLLRGAAIAILERIAVTPEGIDIDLPPSALEILALDQEDRVFYRVVDARGTTLTGTPDLPTEGFFERSLPLQEPIFFDSLYSGETVRFVVNGRTLLSADRPQWIGVQIGQTRIARNAMEADLILKGLVPLAALSIAGVAMARAGIGFAMRPLAGIERDIRERQPNDLEPLGTAPPREVESLITAINGFMRRLDVSRGQAESFIADVAHQMRTSLAALYGHLEAADRPGEAGSRAVARARDQARRTVRLTNQLLSHAMVIHRADKEMFQTTDLGELVRRLMEEIVRDDAAGGIDFAVEMPPPPIAPRVTGDPIAIREALRNLVDNAVRHGPPDNQITLRVTATTLAGRPAYAIGVEDCGPGIAPADKPKVVERFYSSGPGGGSGVGLAIVAAVAESHKGRFDLSDRQPNGLSATITLPETPPPGPVSMP